MESIEPRRTGVPGIVESADAHRRSRAARCGRVGCERQIAEGSPTPLDVRWVEAGASSGMEYECGWIPRRPTPRGVCDEVWDARPGV